MANNFRHEFYLNSFKLKKTLSCLNVWLVSAWIEKNTGLDITKQWLCQRVDSAQYGNCSDYTFQCLKWRKIKRKQEPLKEREHCTTAREPCARKTNVFSFRVQTGSYLQLLHWSAIACFKCKTGTGNMRLADRNQLTTLSNFEAAVSIIDYIWILLQREWTSYRS